MTVITHAGWTLHYLIGDAVAAPVHMGDAVADFRGDTCVVRGGRPPHRVNTSGFVDLSDTEDTPSRECYPSVIGARWIHEGGGHAR